MRVIAGIKRGTKLKAPEGMDTRPTLDRVKQSLFSMIQYEIKGKNVLDLYAGSGGLGIEALSRGATYGDFVEKNKQAYNTLNENLKKTDFLKNSSTYQIEAHNFLRSTSVKYGLVLLDPPYRKNLIEMPLKLLVENDLLDDDALVVIEHPKDENVGLIIDKNIFDIYNMKTYGTICISIYRRKS